MIVLSRSRRRATRRLALCLSILTLATSSALHAQWTRIDLPMLPASTNGLESLVKPGRAPAILTSSIGIFYRNECSDIGWLLADTSVESAVYATDGRFYRLWIHDSVTAQILRSSNHGTSWEPASTRFTIRHEPGFMLSRTGLVIDPGGSAHVGILKSRYIFIPGDHMSYTQFRRQHLRIADLYEGTSGAITETYFDTLEAWQELTERRFIPTDYDGDLAWQARNDSLFVWSDDDWIATGTLPALKSAGSIVASRGWFYYFNSQQGMRSGDSGRTWEPMPTPPPLTPVMARSGNGTLYVLVRTSGESMLLTSTGGAWQMIALPHTLVHDFRVEEDGTILLLDREHVYRSVDGGATWTRTLLYHRGAAWGAAATDHSLFIWDGYSLHFRGKGNTVPWKAARPTTYDYAVPGRMGMYVKAGHELYRFDSTGIQHLIYRAEYSLPLGRTETGALGGLVVLPGNDIDTLILKRPSYTGSDVLPNGSTSPAGRRDSILVSTNGVHWTMKPGDGIEPVAGRSGYLFGVRERTLLYSSDLAGSWTERHTFPAGTRIVDVLPSTESLPDGFGRVHVITFDSSSGGAWIYSFTRSDVIGARLMVFGDTVTDAWIDYRNRLVLQGKKSFFISADPLGADPATAVLRYIGHPCNLDPAVAQSTLSGDGRYLVVASRQGLWQLELNAAATGNVREQTENAPVPMAVFPNPARETVSLTLDEPVRGGRLEIVSPLGETVMSLDEVTGDRIDLDLGYLPAGLYRIRIEANGEAWSLPIVLH